jgi:citrate lyase subunit beta/citryl-CoA lyase
MAILRSLLFAPGNHSRRMQKALEVGADAIIIDLEDAVPIADKEASRVAVREFLQASARAQPRRYVRINSVRTQFAFGDLEAVVVPGLDSIVLPKTERASDVVVADMAISHWERERRLEARRIEIQPIIETAVGIAGLREIAVASSRVRRLSFGSGDFSLDIGAAWDRKNPALIICRVDVVVASRAAGLEAPLDTVFPVLEDEDGLLEETKEARQIGYQGKMAIHPKQVKIINKIFTPTPEEVASAKEICAAFAGAEESGSAAVVVNGVFVDYPVVYKAQRLLEIAAEIGVARPADNAR